MHVVIINGSPRTRQLSNTDKILQSFILGLELEGNTYELYSLSKCSEWNAAREAYLLNEKIIFALPMYVESIPSLMLEFLETLPPQRLFITELSFILHGGFDEGNQFRLCEKLLKSITRRLGCLYGGCLIKGGSFMLRLFGEIEVKNMTKSYVKMGRLYSWNGNFMTTEARDFTGSERYPWLIRQLTGFVLKLVVNRKFEQAAQDWGCTVPLNYKPYQK